MYAVLRRWTVRYMRLYSDADGVSRFEDLEVEFAPRTFVPPAPPVDVSEPIGASEYLMIRVPAGWSDAAHPAPARQLMLFMAGSFEVTAGEETRRIGAGDIVLLENTRGPGHGTVALEDTVIAVVRL